MKKLNGIKVSETRMLRCAEISFEELRRMIEQRLGIVIGAGHEFNVEPLKPAERAIQVSWRL